MVGGSFALQMVLKFPTGPDGYLNLTLLLVHTCILILLTANVVMVIQHIYFCTAYFVCTYLTNIATHLISEHMIISTAI